MATSKTSIDQKAMENRAKFGFSLAVRRHFAYLTDLGFKCVHTEPTLLRYESDQIAVNVYHGRKSCELGVEIGLLVEGDGKEYPLASLIRLSDPEEADMYRSVVALTRESVLKGVARISEAFKKHGWGALRGDRAVFAKLVEQRREIAHSRATDMKVNHVRPRAAEAFRTKDFGLAIQLFQSIRDELSEAELKKLEYARKQAG